MLPAVLVLVFAALLGLAFGSFLNVCIIRLPVGLSIVTPRSRCSACGTPIGAADNIPVLSYLLLRGRCGNCGASISPQYPLVEIATAAWFALSTMPLLQLIRADPAADVWLAATVHLAANCALGFLLIGLAVIDWKTNLLPNEFTLGGLALGTLFAFMESFFVPAIATKTFFTPEETMIGSRIGAALLGYLLLWIIGALYSLLRRRRGMGGGDPKLAAMLGIFLGPGPLMVALFTGIFLAAVFGIFLLLTRRGTGTTRIPFGTFLCAAGLFAAVWGDRIAEWYRQFFV